MFLVTLIVKYEIRIHPLHPRQRGTFSPIGKGHGGGLGLKFSIFGFHH
uniref:Uncharacterized protein n=1 Tax=Kuenenia stuttgartiensis TaxID=174633 RepID=Q1PVP5_KUEST|nr:unknown protein [Candidatus Kuenenia stuttgartiensis]